MLNWEAPLHKKYNSALNHGCQLNCGPGVARFLSFKYCLAQSIFRKNQVSKTTGLWQPQTHTQTHSFAYTLNFFLLQFFSEAQGSCHMPPVWWNLPWHTGVSPSSPMTSVLVLLGGVLPNLDHAMDQPLCFPVSTPGASTDALCIVHPPSAHSTQFWLVDW